MTRLRLAQLQIQTIETDTDTEEATHSMSINTMPTHSSHLVDPYVLHLTPTLIDIRDIVQSLSQTVRWAGMGRVFYSVAEHSTRMAMLVSSPDLVLPALLHDASEAYFRDLPRPIKRRASLDSYVIAEEQCQKAIADRFGVKFPWPDEIYVLDDQLIHAEAEWLDLTPNPDCQHPVEMKILSRIHQQATSSKWDVHPGLIHPGWGWRYAKDRYTAALKVAFEGAGRDEHGDEMVGIL